MTTDSIIIERNGKQYSALKHPILFRNSSQVYTMTGDEEPIEYISTFEEDANNYTLKIGHLFAIINAKDELSFEERIEKVIVFDKTTQKVVSGEKFNKGEFDNIFKLKDTQLFIDSIISLNKNVEDYLGTYPKFIIDGINACSWNCRNFKLNFYNMLVFNLLEFEKLINSNNVKFLETNLDVEGFSLSEANKLHQIIGLPKFAIQLIKEYKLDDYSLDLKSLADNLDGNSFKIFLDFMGNTKLLWNAKGVTSYERERKMKKFFEDCSFILEKKRNYRITDLLNYLLRQVVYYRDSNSIVFPFDEAMYLCDYIKMCENYGLTYEKYPPKIKRSHNLVAKNVSALENVSPEVEEKFKDAVKKYACVERVIHYVPDPKNPAVFTDYAFIVPHNFMSIIQEGNDMHHCVGSYGNLIIDEKARVVFMRLASKKNESLITIDIDKNFDLVEAKKAYNEDVDDEQMKVIQKWIKEIKKTATTYSI